MPTLKERIAALEREAAPPQLGLAEKFRLARERWRAMTPEQRDAKRAERINWAMNSPEPENATRRQLWNAWRRIGAREALQQRVG